MNMLRMKLEKCRATMEVGINPKTQHFAIVVQASVCIGASIFPADAGETPAPQVGTNAGEVRHKIFSPVASISALSLAHHDAIRSVPVRRRFRLAPGN